MNLSKFNTIISLSNDEIIEEICSIENIIFNLRLKKSTRQTFKIHELRNNKRKLAQLKTLSKVREKKNSLSNNDMKKI